MTEITCMCRSEECASRFVMRVSHIHDLTPPRSTLLNSLAEQIANLPRDDRRKLLRTYSDDLPLFRP